jgi:hypothetical protein
LEEKVKRCGVQCGERGDRGVQRYNSSMFAIFPEGSWKKPNKDRAKKPAA